MKPIAASFFVACVAYSNSVLAQSPVLVKYCQDLTTTYRQAVAGGKPAVTGVAQAAANCQTNPNDSIPIIEAALKSMDVTLPPR